MSFLESLLALDKKLFLIINNDLTSDFLNTILPFTRNSITWIPLYLFLFIYILSNFKKTGLMWILIAAATAASTDIVSSLIIKENIFRLRPCQDPSMVGHVHFLLQYCPQSSSFTSSHATTHFGLAMFFYKTLKQQAGKWSALFFLWATAIAYAQVYVGVHYPLDVFCGAIIGSLIGFYSSIIFKNNFSLDLKSK